MKITIKHYDEKFSFETEHDDLSIDKVHDIWERCLVAMTFNQKTVDDFYNNN
jgi:hypothetical protein